MFRRNSQRGQNIFEYVVLIIIVSLALAAMYKYIKRAVNAHIRNVQLELNESKR